jgi:hypothetical protein
MPEALGEELRRMRRFPAVMGFIIYAAMGVR